MIDNRCFSFVQRLAPYRALAIRLGGLGLCLLLAACQSDTKSFTAMSEEEILAYNETQPLLQRVHCVREATTSTRIRKRRCMTVQDWVEHNEKEANRLSILNASPVFEFPRSIR